MDDDPFSGVIHAFSAYLWNKLGSVLAQNMFGRDSGFRAVPDLTDCGCLGGQFVGQVGHARLHGEV